MKTTKNKDPPKIKNNACNFHAKMGPPQSWHDTCYGKKYAKKAGTQNWHTSC